MQSTVIVYESSSVIVIPDITPHAVDRTLIMLKITLLVEYTSRESDTSAYLWMIFLVWSDEF
jgi:hypothetical protein